MKRKEDTLKKYFRTERKSIDDRCPDKLVSTSSTETSKDFPVKEGEQKDVAKRSMIPVEPSDTAFDSSSLEKDEIPVYDGVIEEVPDDDISLISAGTVKSSSSSCELEEKETKVYEKVTDALGNVKIIARNVKDTVKKKKVTYREEASLFSQVTIESYASQYDESVNEANDNYEDVEEEIEEEIEVEEEEIEEEIEVEEEEDVEDRDEDEGEEKEGDYKDKVEESQAKIKKSTESGGKIKEITTKREPEGEKHEIHGKILGDEEESDVIEAVMPDTSTEGSNDEGKAHQQNDKDPQEDDKSGVEDKQVESKQPKMVKKVIRKRIKSIKKSKIHEARNSTDRKISPKTEISKLSKEENVHTESALGIPTVEAFGKKPSIYHQDTDQSNLADIVKNKLLELQNVRRKNKMLHKSICQYYRQKNMTYVYQEENVTTEMVKKYKKKLLFLDDIRQTTAEDREKKNEEINELKGRLGRLENEFQHELKELLEWETELGKCVIDSKTGKPVDEEKLKPLIRRHEYVLKELTEMRLKLIKFQKHLATKLQRVKHFNCLEGNVNIIDYEKLKMDNQVYHEKIEDRENEMSNLRRKMLNIIHEYAHILEKSHNVQSDIEEYKDNLPVIQTNVNTFREYANKLKIQRDSLRSETRKLKKEGGLVFQPRLALDYQESLKKLEERKIQLKKTISCWNEQRSKIERLRQLISDITLFG